MSRSPLTLNFTITWSDEDQEFVGCCTQFESLSWLAPTRDEAMVGILRLVADYLDEGVKRWRGK